nr:alpha/beta fold hydrolase [Kineosphaera limosa]
MPASTTARATKPMPGPEAVSRPEAIRRRLTGMPGLDPAWSRVVRAPDADGVPRAWHVLDTGAAQPARAESAHAESERAAPAAGGTILAVHGNPTWSYLWRHLLAAPPPGWRVVAVDQLGMGFSEDPRGDLTHPRTLRQRIDDLTALTEALDLGPSVVVAGHDWGGLVAAGWALAHRERLSGLVLANTTVQHDFSQGLPLPLRFATRPGLLRAACVSTPAFVAAATAISSPRPEADVRAAYAAPYPDAQSRSFVGQFVADIPARPGHPTGVTFLELADGLGSLDVPALLLRGPKDPVFSEAHLRDLRARLPHADVHRYEGASHLVLEDAPRSAQDIAAWIRTRVEGHANGSTRDDTTDDSTKDVEGRASAAESTRPELPPWAVGTSTHPWAELTRAAREDPDRLCVAEVATGRQATYAQVEDDVQAVALGLAQEGVRPGQRVGVLVEPGIDLTVVIYAAWRLGAVVVVADAGLGAAAMGRALRGAGTDHIIGIPKGIAALPALRIPGARFLAGELPAPARRALTVRATLDELRACGARLRSQGATLPEVVTGDADAAVLFTSGATGPSKGVVYRVDQLRAQIGGFGHIYGLTAGDRLVAAFAPFALYGPALGIGAVVPDMKVTAPSTLTAAALAEAVLAADATSVFASPAALRNVQRTRDDLTQQQRAALAGVRVVMSAGAPVPAALLRALLELFPQADLHTPYGMTECLPVSDITLAQIETLIEGEGVCVGAPLAGVELAVAPLPDDVGAPDGALTSEPEVTGEICVRAAHVKDRYDQLWATQHASADQPPGWHRTGDVGHLDGQGRLWVQGRRAHVVHTAEGPFTPVGLEQRVEALPQVDSAAVTGVGPAGTQGVVVVIVPNPDDDQRGSSTPGRRLPRIGTQQRAMPVLADPEVAAAVRACTARPVAAVLQVAAMPVDIRHQSKIDRTRLGRWAEMVLSGGAVGTP